MTQIVDEGWGFLEDLIATGSVQWQEEFPGKHSIHIVMLHLLDEGQMQEIAKECETVDFVSKDTKMKFAILSRSILSIDHQVFSTDPADPAYATERVRLRELLTKMDPIRIQHLYERYLSVKRTEENNFRARLDSIKKDFGEQDLITSEPGGEEFGK